MELHLQLRLATRHLHTRLDQHPLLAALLARPVPRAGYEQALLGLLAALRGVEPLLTSTPSTPGLPAYRARVPALRDELARLGVTVPAATPPLLQIPDSSACLGVRYVVEGSSLGSRHIQNHLLRQAPWFEPGPYWQLQDRQARAWPRLLRVLANLGPEPQPRQAVIQGAQRCFEHFLHSLEWVHASFRA